MTKILVIEDETLLREEVMEWLAAADYEVVGAADGVEGINLAVIHRPDVILCDIAMPHSDGYDVMLYIRDNSLVQLTPFIFMTAKADLADIRKGMSLGADDYITKPFTYQQLIQSVHTQLEKKALQEAHQKEEIELWRQALAQEREQRQLKAKLVAMFSHDFRNPLATIMSSISIVRDYADRIDEMRRVKHLNRAEASVRQLLQMLDDMLVVSQMETGNLDFKPEQLNIKEFLQRIVEEFQIIHGETHSLVFESEFSDIVMADPRLLHQIAANLISNAIKYSPQGSEIRVFLERDNGQVIMTVRDQGIGIPEVDQPLLFTAFQRASNVGGVSGTGLGLAIVKQAVDLHGGTIHLESIIGGGTTVTVKIPIQIQ